MVELNLIAEDTNQYGMDRKDGRGLAALMRELGALPGLRWMRILYAYPSYFTEELIDEIATNPKARAMMRPAGRAAAAAARRWVRVEGGVAERGSGGSGQLHASSAAAPPPLAAHPLPETPNPPTTTP